MGIGNDTSPILTCISATLGARAHLQMEKLIFCLQIRYICYDIQYLGIPVAQNGKIMGSDPGECMH